jgi:hypothetical protein
MSKVTDGARVAGSHEADRVESGETNPAGGDSMPSAQGGSDLVSTVNVLRRSRRAAAAPVDALPERREERELRARVPGGRRDRRRQESARTPAVGVMTAGVGDTASDAVALEIPDQQTLGEARDARAAVAGDARALAGRLASAGSADPFAVDPGLLMQQKALAERAAALNARARRGQAMPDQTTAGSFLSDPTTAHNLSIITPPEFVRVPGSSHSVLRAPTTSHIPIVVVREQAGRPAESVGAQRDAGPIGARSAFGLDPLDAMTAGLRRMRRIRYIQYSMIGVGAAALSTGIIMTVSSLNG